MQPTQDDIPLHSRTGRGLLLATILGSGMAFLDGTVVNVALPALGRALRAQMSGLQWTLDAYLLFLTALLLVGGALGDKFGQRTTFTLGIVGFALASGVCGLAPNLGFLIAARALQGIFAALLIPGSLALLRENIRREDQGTAIGLWAGLSGVTTAAGPLLGGYLVDSVSWRAIFFLNLPLAAVALWTALKFAPKPVALGTRKPDILGSITAAFGLGLLTYAFIEGPPHGWNKQVLGIGLAGLLLFGGFLWLEGRRKDPMLPLSLFRNRQFTGANLTTLCVYFALSASAFVLVVALQQAAGFSALGAGAVLLPVTLLMLLISPLAGRWTQKVGHRLPMTLGPLVTAFGMLLVARAGLPYRQFAPLLPGILLFGLGLSFTVAPLTDAVLAGADRERAGIASGVNNAVARLAGLLAVAVLPWLAKLPNELGNNAGLYQQGVRRAMLIGASLCVLGALTSFVLIPGNKRPKDQRTTSKDRWRRTEV